MIFLAQTLLTAGLASAATIRVDVGKGGFVFSPNEVKAAVGDSIVFHYLGGNHSVVQGDFDNPCHPVTTAGFYSGYFPAQTAENPNVFTLTINSTDPIAYYCSQQQHCQNGMVGVINPTNASSYTNYAGAAKSATENVAPSTGAYGGTVGPAPKDTSSSSATPSGTASPTSSPSASTTPNGAGVVGASFAGIAAAVGFAVFLA